MDGLRQFWLFLDETIRILFCGSSVFEPFSGTDV